MKRISLFLLLLTASVFSFAQDFSNKGKDFWLGYGYHVRYVTNGGGVGGPNGQEMVLYFATENNPGKFTNIKIEIPALGDRKSTRLNSSHPQQSRMPSSA